jgi:hypothetical protein
MQKDLAIILASIIAGGIYMACTPDVVDPGSQGGGGIAQSCGTNCSAFCGCQTSCTAANCDDFACGSSSFMSTADVSSGAANPTTSGGTGGTDGTGGIPTP